MIYKNTANQKISVFAYTASTGAAKTGGAANITCYLSKDWGAAAAVTDTNPTELDATNMPGWYVFDLAQAETNAEVLVFAPVSATSGVVLDQVQVFTQDATISSRAAAATALSNVTWTDAKAGYLTGAVALEATLTAIKGAGWTTETLAAIDALIDAIKAKTDTIPASPAAVGSAMTLANDAVTAAALAADAVTEIQSGLATAASVADVPTVAEFEARTLPSANYFDPAADTVANVTTVATVTNGVIVADKTGFALSAAGVDAILDEVVEGAYTMRQMLRLFVSVLASKASGGGTNTITFRDVGDTKARITMTVDANGDRSAVVLDVA